MTRNLFVYIPRLFQTFALTICLTGVAATAYSAYGAGLPEADRAGQADAQAGTAHPVTPLTIAKLNTDQRAELIIEGAISGGDGQGRTHVDMDTLRTLTPYRLATSTAVTDGVVVFDGVLMRDLMDYVGVQGKQITATALNGYQVDIPLSDFRDFDVLLAWAANGELLKPNDKGPFWIVYPRDQHSVLQDIRYDYRWVWQLKALQVK